MPRQTAAAWYAVVYILRSLEPSKSALFHSVPSYSQSIIGRFHCLLIDHIAIPFGFIITAFSNKRSRLDSDFYPFSFLKTCAIGLNQYLLGVLYPQSVYGLDEKTQNSRLFLRSDVNHFTGRLQPYKVQTASHSGLPNCKTVFPFWECPSGTLLASMQKTAPKQHNSAFQQSLTPQKHWHSFDNKDAQGKHSVK